MVDGDRLLYGGAEIGYGYKNERQNVLMQNKKIICEATALQNPEAVQNSKGLVGDGAVYLCAFRTVKEYQGKGYFSKLMQFMLDDLREKGFTRATLGVEPAEEINKKIYAHYGFTEYVKRAEETYPDGTVITVDYFAKNFMHNG